MPHKKIIASAIALSIVFSTPMAYAYGNSFKLESGIQNNIITKNEAMERASKIYPELNKKGAINVDLMDKFGIYGDKVWRVYSTDDNLLNIYVNANTGEIMSFRIPEKIQQSKYYMPKYTKKECIQAAGEAIKALQPDEYMQVKYNQDASNSIYINDGVQKPILYTFSFVREVNGIPFAKDGFKVTIDAYTNQIVKYDFNWQSAFELNINNIVTADKAKGLLKDYAKPRLMYVKQSKKDSKNDKYKLIYSIPYGIYYNTDFAGIDAQKGTPVNHEGKATETYMQILEGTADNNESQSKDANEPLDKKLDSNDIDKAFKIAKSELNKLNVSTKDYTNITSKYDQDFNSTGVRTFIFEWVRNSKDSSSLSSTIKVVINADTKKVQELICNSPIATLNDEDKSSVSWEGSKEKAKEFAAKSFPNVKNDLIFIGVEPKNSKVDVSNNSYCFTFLRLADRSKQIIYPENYVNVNMDKKTGAITGYGYKWEDIEFPTVGDIISMDSAQEIYIQNAGVQLNYKYTYSDKNTLNKNGVLVYEAKPFNYAYIDAYTGVIKGFDGTDYIQKSNNNTNLDMSKYTKDANVQRQLEILDDIKALDIDENFNVNNTITCDQFIKIIVKLKGIQQNLKLNNAFDESSIPYEKIARIMGLINVKIDFNGNYGLTRQEMAQIIINFMGYDDLDKMKEFSNSPFKDKLKFDQDKLTAATIANSLEIVIANEQGNFEPTKTVTIQDAIQSIFKALQ